MHPSGRLLCGPAAAGARSRRRLPMARRGRDQASWFAGHRLREPRAGTRPADRVIAYLHRITTFEDKTMADISLNPVTPVTNGALVGSSNPLPVYNTGVAPVGGGITWGAPTA